MRIVIYSRPFPPTVGGMERFAETLARWLAADGHDVVALTSTPGAKGAAGYRVMQLGSLLEIGRIMRWAEVVHVNGLSARSIGWAISSGRRPVVTHQTYQALCPTGLAWAPSGSCSAGPRPGPCHVCPSRGAFRVAAQRFAARAAVSVFISRHQQARIGLPGRCIYNPVDVPPREEIPETETAPGDVVAFAGRLVQEKGLDVLLRALSLVPDARLRVAGDGPMRESWERLAEDLGVASRTSFLGALPPAQVRALYAGSTLVCVPSLCPEAFGYAAAEAMAIGRPVVGLPSGALTELLDEDRGFLARMVSAPALAEQLQRGLDDSDRRRTVGQSARSFSEQELDIGVLGPKYLDAYSS